MTSQQFASVLDSLKIFQQNISSPIIFDTYFQDVNDPAYLTNCFYIYNTDNKKFEQSYFELNEKGLFWF